MVLNPEVRNVKLEHYGIYRITLTMLIYTEEHFHLSVFVNTSFRQLDVHLGLLLKFIDSFTVVVAVVAVVVVVVVVV